MSTTVTAINQTKGSVVVTGGNTRNLYRRLLDAGSEVGMVPKSKKKGMQFATVEHDDVTRMVRPVLCTHGVFAFSSVVVCNQDGNRTELTVRTVFVNADAPTERIEVDTVGYGCGNDDKGPGKAMSYAVKYALLKTLGLETGEDSDLHDGRHRRDTAPGAPGLRRSTASPHMDLHAVVTSFSGAPWTKEDVTAWDSFRQAHEMPASGKSTDEQATTIVAYLVRRHAAGHTWSDVLSSPDPEFK